MADVRHLEFYGSKNEKPMYDFLLVVNYREQSPALFSC